MENGLSEIAFKKPANLYGYWSKLACIYIDLKFWWMRGELNPPSDDPKSFSKALRYDLDLMLQGTMLQGTVPAVAFWG